ncbi:MAG TPA: RRXRR domain-containing protein [Chitinophagaceae bacterium]|nr:RRXRR domain-containing protein [Chitinophagaceae bacterium]
MDVYILNKHGTILMPCKPRKARLLLKECKAKVVNMKPFTIQLLFGSTGYKQPITVGVNTGTENAGVTVISGNQDLNSCEFKLRKHVSLKGHDRRIYRGNMKRRRYRKPRFDNRASSKKAGRPPPDVQGKGAFPCCCGLLMPLSTTLLLPVTAPQ